MNLAAYAVERISKNYRLPELYGDDAGVNGLDSIIENFPYMGRECSTYENFLRSLRI